MAICAADSIKICDWATFELKNEFKIERCNHLVALSNNQIVACFFGNTTIRIWDISSDGTCICTLDGHSNDVSCLALVTGNILASGSLDKTIKLWSLNSYECIQTIDVGDYVFSLLCLADNLMACGSYGNKVQIWDLSSYKCIQTLTGHNSSINCLALVPSLNRIASASVDKTIRIWSITHSKCIAILEGHTSAVNCLQLLSDDILTSASYDKTIKMWDMFTFRCLKTLTGHSNLISSLAILPGQKILSASRYGILKIWGTLMKQSN